MSKGRIHPVTVYKEMMHHATKTKPEMAVGRAKSTRGRKKRSSISIRTSLTEALRACKHRRFFFFFFSARRRRSRKWARFPPGYHAGSEEVHTLIRAANESPPSGTVADLQCKRNRSETAACPGFHRCPTDCWACAGVGMPVPGPLGHHARTKILSGHV